jgi:hypothetical protein
VRHARPHRTGRLRSSAPPGTILVVEVTAAATIWALFACFLLFPHLGLPPMLHRGAMTLLVAELVALAMWSYGSKGCLDRPCAPVAEAGYDAASLDVPLLAVALIVLAVIRGARVWRRERRLRERRTRSGSGSGSSGP